MSLTAFNVSYMSQHHLSPHLASSSSSSDMSCDAKSDEASSSTCAEIVHHLESQIAALQQRLSSDAKRTSDDQALQRHIAEKIECQQALSSLLAANEQQQQQQQQQQQARNARSVTKSDTSISEFFRETLSGDEAERNPADWPGENGSMVLIENDDALAEEAKRRFAENNFNVVISDHIALNRHLPDQRSQK